MKRPPSSGQHFRIGSSSSVPSLRTTSWHGASFTVFGIRSLSRLTSGSSLSASRMPFGHRRRHELVDLAREVVELLDAKRQAHALERAEDVRRHRHVEAGGLLEQQRRTAAGRLARAIGDGGDLEIGADRLGHARQQLAAIEVGEEVVEIWVHARACLSRSHEAADRNRIVSDFVIFVSS